MASICGERENTAEFSQFSVVTRIINYTDVIFPTGPNEEGFFFLFFFLILFFLFLAVLGLRFCARAFSSCGKQGPLFITVRGLLTVAASLVAEHRLQTRRLSSCGSRAQFLRGMWDLPGPGLEPVSPALAGRLSTTALPEKPKERFLKCVQQASGNGQSLVMFV